MMMKLRETFVRDCYRRPDLVCQAKWRVDKRTKKKRGQLVDAHMHRHTLMLPHTLSLTHLTLHTTLYFVINLNVTIQHRTGNETTTI